VIKEVFFQRVVHTSELSEMLVGGHFYVLTNLPGGFVLWSIVAHALVRTFEGVELTSELN
jgi:hypothetical protein